METSRSIQIDSYYKFLDDYYIRCHILVNDYESSTIGWIDVVSLAVLDESYGGKFPFDIAPININDIRIDDIKFCMDYYLSVTLGDDGESAKVKTNNFNFYVVWFKYYMLFKHIFKPTDVTSFFCNRMFSNGFMNCLHSFVKFFKG